MVRFHHVAVLSLSAALTLGLVIQTEDTWPVDERSSSRHSDPAACPTPNGATPVSSAVASRTLVPRERLLGAGGEPVAFCFAPGTEPEIIAYYNQIMETDPTGPRYHLAGRWSAQGSPRALTWSFVPDGLSMEGGSSELFSRLDELFAAQGGRATWIARIQSCFDRWASLTGTSYTRITVGGNDWDDGASWGSGGNANHGDVRIGMVPIDGSFGVLAFNYYPSNGDMVLDRDDNWGSPGNSNRFLRNVVMHEHGHGLGLQHVCSSNSLQLMEPFLSTLFDGPRDDDVRGAQRHYGDDFEANDSAAAATNLGALEVGAPLALGAVPLPNIPAASLLSLDADGENDYFRFSVSGDRTATITITPIGRTYDNSTQNGDGSCNSGSNIDTLALTNLNVQLIAGDGSTVLPTSAVQPSGVAETLSNVFLGTGNYFARVYEEGVPSQAQFYTLSFSAAFLDCDFNGVGDPCDLSCDTLDGVCDVPGCGQSADCNATGTPDACELSGNDCNANAIPDECDLSGADCNGNSIPDGCEFAPSDCNSNGVLDGCDIAGGVSFDANGNGMPDECEIPAATITGASSRNTCDVVLAPAPSITTEPRQVGITEIRIAFSSPPGGPGPSPIILEEKQCPSPGAYVPYAGASAIGAIVVGNELVVTFTPGLENLRTYRMTIGGSVTSLPGQSVEVRGLTGDSNSDGLVNSTDRSVVVGVWTGAGFSCLTDLNTDGLTNSTDRSIVVGAWSGGQNCSP